MSCNNEDLGRLSNRDKELVALGAAIASNCIPCIEYHIPQARKTGLSDLEIGQAVALADKVRRVPAEKVLQTASSLLARQELPCSTDSPRLASGYAPVGETPDAVDFALASSSSEIDLSDFTGAGGGSGNSDRSG